MYWAIAGYSILGCIGMAIQDYAGTVLVKSVHAGKGWLAGSMDAVMDLTKITILSVSGVELTHAYGWRGWFGVLPIMVTGFVVTWHATHLSKGIENEDEEAEDNTRDERLRALEGKLKAIQTRLEGEVWK